MKKNILLVIAIIAIVGLIFYFEPNKVEVSQNTDGEEIKISDKPSVKIIENVDYPLAPELAGISGYLNTQGEEIKIADYSGKVILVDFWTYTCINCIRTLPYLTVWDEKYRDKGLVIIGIHSPEFEFEKKSENVQKALERYGVDYPIVQDNDKLTWAAFNNRYWPAKYLIDSEGYVRYYHFGEGAYEETEMKIQELLEEAGNDADISLTQETVNPRYPTTPELYAGAVFALPREQYIGNKKTSARQEDYSLPESLNKRNVIYLEGLWTHNADNLQLDADSGIIALDYTASEVNIVASPLERENDVLMEVLIDGEHVSIQDAGSDVIFEENKAFIKVDENRLYNVFNGDYGEHRLDLKVSKGFRFNAFTFG